MNFDDIVVNTKASKASKLDTTPIFKKDEEDLAVPLSDKMKSPKICGNEKHCSFAVDFTDANHKLFENVENETQVADTSFFTKVFNMVAET